MRLVRLGCGASSCRWLDRQAQRMRGAISDGNVHALSLSLSVFLCLSLSFSLCVTLSLSIALSLSHVLSVLLYRPAAAMIAGLSEQRGDDGPRQPIRG